MSDDRVVLVAKRKNYGNFTNKATPKNDGDSSKRGLKRPLPSPQTPKKNIANDRLKRLRTTLKEDVERSSSSPNVAFNRAARKRSQDGVQSDSVVLPKAAKNSGQSVFNNPELPKSFSFVRNKVEASVFSFGSFLTPQIVASSSTNVENEDMEWDPCSQTSDSALVEDKSSTISAVPASISAGNCLFIVVDTNIFIEDLGLIKNITDTSNSGNKKAVVFVPWIVFEELDFIKDDTNKKNGVKWKAQEAVKFINNALNNKNERIRGQTMDEASQQRNTGNSQDNKIIACCLQVLEKYGPTLLLSNDINLRNKAQINNIPAYSNKDVLGVIKTGATNNKYNNNKDDNSKRSKSDAVLSKMTSLCTSVIRTCASKAFGEAFQKMSLARLRPRSLPECLKVFKKYWFTVFQDLLMKQFKHRAENLNKFLHDHKCVKDGSKDFDELFNLCMNICVYFKDVEQCKSAVESAIEDLKNIKKA